MNNNLITELLNLKAYMPLPDDTSMDNLKVDLDYNGRVKDSDYEGVVKVSDLRGILDKYAPRPKQSLIYVPDGAMIVPVNHTISTVGAAKFDTYNETNRAVLHLEGHRRVYGASVIVAVDSDRTAMVIKCLDGSLTVGDIYTNVQFINT